MPIRHSFSGRGGSVIVHIACSGCGVQVDFASSSMSATESRRNVVSYAIRIAAFASGIGFAGYHKLFGRHLGMNVTTDKMFHRVIEEAYPHITDMLDEVCELGKEEMKSLPSDKLGSWQRAVTTSDGCWHIRGFFSQNGTFVIRNWLTGALLWYGHACMRGSDPIMTDELYHGTAKSIEGYLAGVLFEKAKEEGCTIEINWQDQDSSSEKSFRAVYTSETSSRVMKCGGHVGRAHAKALKDLKPKKEFDTGYIAKHKDEFPDVEKVVCCCKGKRHSAKCGCLTDGFIESARRNLFCAITQCGNNATAFDQRMRDLGRYHARGIHKWDGGECDFHPLLVCCCGKCEKDDMKCPGKEYQSTNVLTCPLHALAYEIECNHRADHAREIIDPELGRGHSNACEATFTVFPKFRPKDVGLQRLHYQASTNLALIQSSMTYLYTKRGPDYHWILDLFERMGLPLFDGMKEQVCLMLQLLNAYKVLIISCVYTTLYLQCVKDNINRMTKLKKRKEEKVKNARIEHKKRRAEEQSKRYDRVLYSTYAPNPVESKHLVVIRHLP